MLLIFLLYFLYSIIFVIGKFAIEVSQPVFLTGIRMVTAGVISYGIHYYLYGNFKFSSLRKNDWVVLCCLAFFNVYITNAGEFWALQYLSAGKTSFIYNVSPFFALLFSSLLFSESITVKKLVGMMIGFISLMPMLIETGIEKIDTTVHLGFLSIAEIVLLCSAAATALGWTLMKYFVDKKNFTPYFLNGFSLVLGGLLCLLHSYNFESRPFVEASSYYSFMFYMLIMMLIQNVIAYNLHAYLLRYYTATLIALFSFLMPLITLLLGYLFLQEAITYKFFACSLGVAVGLLIFYYEDMKKEYICF